MKHMLVTKAFYIAMHAVYCKSFEVEKFCFCGMNCNPLEDVHCCMVVLCGQIILHMDISIFYWKHFVVNQLIHENRITFPPQTIYNIRYVYVHMYQNITDSRWVLY